jgi:glutathione S-transferase
VRRLLTIPISHYCEKARWALDRAGLDYVEERHVQGIHQFKAKRAGGGMTVPVLVTDEGVYPESDLILRYADERVDEERRLFPADPEQRREVEELCHWLDEGLGPDGRRVIYAFMLPLKDTMLRYNNQGVPRWEDRTLRLLWPPITWWAKRHLKIGDTTIRNDTPRVREVFDAIGERLADGRPFLCGERFSAADLTFACLSTPVLAPPEYGITLPQPEDMPEPLAGAVRSFREHPAGAYVLKLYRTERRVTARAADTSRDPSPAS